MLADSGAPDADAAQDGCSDAPAILEQSTSPTIHALMDLDCLDVNHPPETLSIHSSPDQNAEQTFELPESDGFVQHNAETSSIRNTEEPAQSCNSLLEDSAIGESFQSQATLRSRECSITQSLILEGFQSFWFGFKQFWFDFR